MLSTLSFLTPTALYLIHCTGWTYLIWISSTVECVVFCLPAHLSQQALHDQCKGREIVALSRERRRENFLLFQIFFFRACNFCIPHFSGTGLETLESQNLRNAGQKENVGSHPSPASCLRKNCHQHKVSGFVREPWRHRRMDTHHFSVPVLHYLPGKG